MNRYLFLIAWFDGSESASGETKVNRQEDLKTQYLAKNDQVFAVVIHARTEQVALALGYKEAFFQNYTGHDSCSDMIEIDDDFAYHLPDKVIREEI